MAKKNEKNNIDNDDMLMILAEFDYQLMMMHSKLMIIQEHLGYDPATIFDMSESKFDELIKEDME